MLYETLRQAVVFFTMLYFGVIGGIIYELKTVLTEPFKKNKVIVAISDVLFFVLLFVVFFYACQLTNYGEVRLFMLLSFFLGFYLERISIGSLLAKAFCFLYNKISLLIKKLKTKNKRKNKDEAVNT